MLYALKKDMPLILSLVLKAFPAPATSEESKTSEGYVSDATLLAAATALDVPSDFDACTSTPTTGVQYVYHTTVGDGPRTYGVEDALLDVETGLPK